MTCTKPIEYSRQRSSGTSGHVITVRRKEECALLTYTTEYRILVNWDEDPSIPLLLAPSHYHHGVTQTVYLLRELTGNSSTWPVLSKPLSFAVTQHDVSKASTSREVTYPDLHDGQQRSIKSHRHYLERGRFTSTEDYNLRGILQRIIILEETLNAVVPSSA